eukprot:scaffold6922_cov76-Alexandrium_tamarense.AAC.1
MRPFLVCLSQQQKQKGTMMRTLRLLFLSRKRPTLTDPQRSARQELVALREGFNRVENCQTRFWRTV